MVFLFRRGSDFDLNDSNDFELYPPILRFRDCLFDTSNLFPPFLCFSVVDLLTRFLMVCFRLIDITPCF